MVILIICIVAIIACIILIEEVMERQREIEWKKKVREIYKECTGHYPEEAEAVAIRQEQEFGDILKRQDLWKLQLMLVVPDGRQRQYSGLGAGGLTRRDVRCMMDEG